MYRAKNCKPVFTDVEKYWVVKRRSAKGVGRATVASSNLSFSAKLRNIMFSGFCFPDFFRSQALTQDCL